MNIASKKCVRFSFQIIVSQRVFTLQRIFWCSLARQMEGWSFSWEATRAESKKRSHEEEGEEEETRAGQEICPGWGASGNLFRLFRIWDLDKVLRSCSWPGLTLTLYTCCPSGHGRLVNKLLFPSTLINRSHDIQNLHMSMRGRERGEIYDELVAK